MKKTQKDLEAVYGEVKTAESESICLLFDNKQSSRLAIDELKKRGHGVTGNNIFTTSELLNKPCQVWGESVDSDKEFMKKVVLGIKRGALIGSTLAAILILFSIFRNTSNLSLNLILILGVGTAGGAVISFLLGPLLPFKHQKYYPRKILSENVIIRLWVKTKREKDFFKHAKWTMCQIG